MSHEREELIVPSKFQDVDGVSCPSVVDIGSSRFVKGCFSQNIKFRRGGQSIVLCYKKVNNSSDRDDNRTEEKIAIKFFPAKTSLGGVRERSLVLAINKRDRCGAAVRLLASARRENLVMIAYPCMWGDFIHLSEALYGTWSCKLTSLMDYVREAANALLYLHSVGIVHGDVKPDNILVDSNGSIKWTDFSLSSVEGEYQGASGGTPGYLSQKRVVNDGGRCSKRDDWSAMAFVAAVVLTMVPPPLGTVAHVGPSRNCFATMFSTTENRKLKDDSILRSGFESMAIALVESEVGVAPLGFAEGAFNEWFSEPVLRAHGKVARRQQQQRR
jgi:serine/threonine protein kinase